MSEVREVCDEMLAGPVPPMMSTVEMLGVARRARRRRTWLSVAGAAGMAVTAAAVTVALLPGPAAPKGDGVEPVAALVQTDEQALDAVTALLPPGYSVRRSPTGADVINYDVPDMGVVKGANSGAGGVSVLGGAAAVYAGDRAGEINVQVIADGKPAPTGDLCETVKGWEAFETACEVVTVNGVSVRVGTVNENGMLCVYAFRYVTGARAEVMQCRSVRDQFESVKLPGLTAQIFTNQQLAAAAALPSLLG